MEIQANEPRCKEIFKRISSGEEIQVTEATWKQAFELLSDREAYPKACLVGPRKIGKTKFLRELQKKTKRRVLVDAYKRIADAIYFGEVDKLIPQLEKVEIIELSPYQYEWLYDHLQELDSKLKNLLENFMKNTVILKWDKKDELEKYEYTFLGQKRETYHPDLTRWHRQLLAPPKTEIIKDTASFLQRISGTLESAAQAIKNIGKTDLLKIAEALGMTTPPVAAIAKAALLALAFVEPKVDLTRERILQLHSLHPAELEKWEKKLGMEPGTLEALRDAPRKVEAVEKQVSEVLVSNRAIATELKEIENQLVLIEEEIKKIRGLAEKILEELLPYQIITSPEELRLYLRLPDEAEIVEPKHPWYRNYIKQVVEKASKGAAAIVAPPGCGKTVILYQIAKKLLAQGTPVAIIDEAKIKHLALGKTHIQEGIFLIIDDLSDSDVFETLADSLNAKQIIYTARAMIQETLLNSYSAKKRGKKPERIVEAPLNPPPEAAKQLVLAILSKRKARVREKDIDELMRRLETTYKTYKSTLLYYAALLAKENAGKTVDPGKLPSFADYLIDILERRLLAANLVTTNLEPTGGREAELAATIYTLSLIALLENEITDKEARKFYDKVLRALGAEKSGKTYPYLRVASRWNGKIGYEHFTWKLLLTPDPHYWPETRQLFKDSKNAGKLNRLYNAIAKEVEEIVKKDLEQIGIRIDALANQKYMPNIDLIAATLPALTAKIHPKIAEKIKIKTIKHLSTDIAKALFPIFAQATDRITLANYAYYSPLIPNMFLKHVDALAEALTKQKIAEAAWPLETIAEKLNVDLFTGALSSVDCWSLGLDVFAACVRLGYRGRCGGFKGLLVDVAEGRVFAVFPLIVLGKV